jgi:carboxyl-terminal processing protease
MQKFYRVNGGSTQLKGVNSDIMLPDKYEKLYKGEREEEFPMPWDEIKPATINAWAANWNIEDIKKKSKSRVENDLTFKQIRALEEKFKKQADNTLLSLNLDKYRLEQKKNTEETDVLEKLEKEGKQLNAYGMPLDLEKIASDSTKKVMNEEWIKSVKKDTYIKEAVHVIKDMN